MFPSSETHNSGDTELSGDAAGLAEVQDSTFRAVSLARLAALVQLRATAQNEFGAEAALHRRLVGRAIFSVYEDCVAAGARDGADEIIGKGGQESGDKE